MAAKLLWVSAGVLLVTLGGAIVERGGPGFARDTQQLAATGTSTTIAAATATAVPLTATPTATPTPTPEPQPTATLPPPVSDVAPATQPPRPPAPPPSPNPVVRGGTNLPVPGGTAVVWGGCASDGICYPYNFYWAPTREAVLHLGEGPLKVQHEMCHAHQHLSINSGAPLRPSDYDLESWYETSEGRSFAGAVAGHAWPWQHGGAQNLLEDFAWTCAYWYLAPAQLLDVSPQGYRWAEANLP